MSLPFDSELFKIVTGKSFQFPKGNRLEVQKYFYNHPDEWIHGYRVYKALDLPRPNIAFHYINWAYKRGLMDSSGEMVDGRMRKTYRFNSVGLEFCKYHFRKYGIDVAIIAKEITQKKNIASGDNLEEFSFREKG